jgi:nucleotide-binding universal stress UspA family protein
MKSVLAAVDFSDLTDDVIERAALLARSCSARLWLVHVAASDPEFVGYDVGPRSTREARATELRDEHRTLQAIAERLRAEGLETVALLVQGPTVETILEQAAKTEADVVVVGSHGHGAVYRVVVGSVTEGVLRKSGRPVLVVPARHDAP